MLCRTHLILFFIFSIIFSVSNADNSNAFQQALKAADYDRAVDLASKNQVNYLHELLQKVEQKRMWETPMWQTLMHYKKNTIMNGYTSMVDGQDYFLSKSGRTNPKAELMATVASFFSGTHVAPTGLTPQCRFIARFQWIDEQINIDEKKLAKENCELFEIFYEAADPQSLTLVFASAYANSASSAFGHTLIRIDKKGRSKETSMLDFSINFAATVDENDSAAMYVAKGIVGGYQGRFTVLPYHMKLREYAQMESRDIWEYTLTLTEEQTRFVLMHAYELVPTYFDYYYFSENCSFYLMALLDVVNPEEPLVDEVKPWTVPLDTIKLLEKRNLIKETYFRPSLRGKIEYQRQQLSEDKQDAVIKLVGEDTFNNAAVDAYSNQDQAILLDLAYDYSRYNKIQTANELAVALNKNERAILKARSQLNYQSDKLDVKPLTARPDKGHDTTKVSLGVGQLAHSQFVETRWRATYHSDLDATTAYAANSNLQFFNLSIRQYEDSDSPEIGAFTLFNLDSISNVDRFFKQYSWHLVVDYQSYAGKKDERQGVSRFAGGAGYAADVYTGIKTFVYGYLDTQLLYSEGFDNPTRLAIGPHLGVKLQLTSKWKINGRAEINWDALNSNDRSYDAGVFQSYAVDRNLSVELAAHVYNLQKNRDLSISTSVNYFY